MYDGVYFGESETISSVDAGTLFPTWLGVSNIESISFILVFRAYVVNSDYSFIHLFACLFIDNLFIDIDNELEIDNCLKSLFSKSDKRL